jgi:LuxR family transcriptional regulator, quorum-sensing system regulator SolR
MHNVSMLQVRHRALAEANCPRVEDAEPARYSMLTMNLGHSTCELKALSGILDDVFLAADSTVLLDRLMLRVQEVLPFKRSVVLHDCVSPNTSCGLVYRAGLAAERHCGSVRQSTCGVALGVDQYVSRFEITHRVGHAFAWKSTSGKDVQGDAQIDQIANHLGDARGLAAKVSSSASNGDRWMTLLQFECADSNTSQMQLLGLITVFVHMLLGTGVSTMHDEPYTSASMSLTAREREVLRWVVQGKTSWEIGRILSTSERTVKFHLRNVYTKLNVSNRAQAVAVVNKLRLI